MKCEPSFAPSRHSPGRPSCANWTEWKPDACNRSPWNHPSNDFTKFVPAVFASFAPLTETSFLRYSLNAALWFMKWPAPHYSMRFCGERLPQDEAACFSDYRAGLIEPITSNPGV